MEAKRAGNCNQRETDWRQISKVLPWRSNDQPTQARILKRTPGVFLEEIQYKNKPLWQEA
jgi:hypothetical protein